MAGEGLGNIRKFGPTETAKCVKRTYDGGVRDCGREAPLLVEVNGKEMPMCLPCFHGLLRDNETYQAQMIIKILMKIL